MESKIYYYLMPFIITMGILTCYTDVRYHKIKNIHLLFLSFLIILLYIFLFVFKRYFSVDFLKLFFLNFLTSLIIGFIFYINKLWGAGDAKLFILYSLLILPNKYSNILPLFSFVLFTNTFLISTIMLLPFLIIKYGKEIFQEVIRLGILWEPTKTFLITFSIVWIVRPILEVIKFENDFFINFTLIYLLYFFIYRLIYKFKKNVLLIIILIGLFLHILTDPSAFAINNLIILFKKILCYSIIFYILRVMIYKKGISTSETNRIPFAPFLFIGLLISQTKFLLKIISFISVLQK